MENLNAAELLELLGALEDEQSLYEERARIASRLAHMFRGKTSEIEQYKAEIGSLLHRLCEAEQIYGKHI